MNSNAKPVETGSKKLLPVPYEIQKLNALNAGKMKVKSYFQCLPQGYNRVQGAIQLPAPDSPEVRHPAVRETANKSRQKVSESLTENDHCLKKLPLQLKFLNLSESSVGTEQVHLFRRQLSFILKKVFLGVISNQLSLLMRWIPSGGKHFGYFRYI